MVVTPLKVVVFLYNEYKEQSLYYELSHSPLDCLVLHCNGRTVCERVRLKRLKREG
jgi:hypothetical protein